MWEDDYNKQGGRWLINLDKKQRMTCLDNFWLEVMLCLIGESFEDDSQLVSRHFWKLLFKFVRPRFISFLSIMYEIDFDVYF